MNELFFPRLFPHLPPHHPASSYRLLCWQKSNANGLHVLNYIIQEAWRSIRLQVGFNPGAHTSEMLWSIIVSVYLRLVVNSERWQLLFLYMSKSKRKMSYLHKLFWQAEREECLLHLISFLMCSLEGDHRGPTRHFPASGGSTCPYDQGGNLNKVGFCAKGQQGKKDPGEATDNPTTGFQYKCWPQLPTKAPTSL